MAVCELEKDLTFTERNRRRIVELIRQFQAKSDQGASIIAVMDQMHMEGLSRLDFPRYLISLAREGLIFPIDEEHVKTIR